MELLVSNIVSETWVLMHSSIVDARETGFEKLDWPKSGHCGGLYE